MANQMLMVAVAWQMYDITSSAWDLGLVGLFQFVPALLMTLPAGHVADRLHRGRIFATCMMIQAAIALLLLAATEGNFASRGLILGVSVVLGVVRAFQMPAQQALTPLLVPEELLPHAIALSSIGVQTAIVWWAGTRWSALRDWRHRHRAGCNHLVSAIPRFGAAGSHA